MPETIVDVTLRDTFANFAAAVGQPFDLLAGETMERLTLVEATPSGAPHAAGAREPFALLFKGATQTILPQGIWRMRHATIGELDIFLVPVGRDAHGVTYQAVFS